MGDLSTSEIAQRTVTDPAGWIGQLAGTQRIVQLAIPTSNGIAERWVAAELRHEYHRAFAPPINGKMPEDPPKLAPATEPTAAARRAILLRYLQQTGPVTEQTILARYAFPQDWLQSELAELVETQQLAHGRFTPDATNADEYVDRQTLAEMHRRTLSILRKEVQPVRYATYAEFLTRLHHLHPATRLQGAGALHQILQQLRALPIVGRIWERDVLPLRIADEQPAALAELCQNGEVVWVGSGGVDPRRGRIRFLFRGEGSIYLEAAPTDLADESLNLSEAAQTIYAFLKSEGALFQRDIQRALELPGEEIERRLRELAMAGLVTNDSLHALHQLTQGDSPTAVASRTRVQSTLEAQLAERLGKQRRDAAATQWSTGRRPSRSEMQAARRRVRQRLERAEEAIPSINSVGPQEGRWSPVHRFGVLGKALEPSAQVARQARQLLARWGIVTHATLANEQGAWAWETLYAEFQRLEMRGEVRRGYFVQELPGIQFALPEVVEQLRELNMEQTVIGQTVMDQTVAEETVLVLLNACDPANLYGPTLSHPPLRHDGEPLTFTRIPSTWIVQQRGIPILLIEGNGTHITTGSGVDDELSRRALQCWLNHITRFERRLSIEQWNGEGVLSSAGQPLLESLAFYREYPSMVWSR